MKKFKLGWPTVTLASVAIVAFVAIYLLAPDDRDMIEKAVLGVWALVSTFLGAAVRKHDVRKHDDEGGES